MSEVLQTVESDSAERVLPSNDFGSWGRLACVQTVQAGFPGAETPDDLWNYTCLLKRTISTEIAESNSLAP